MKTNGRLTLRAFGFVLLASAGFSPPLRADQFGLFTYTVVGGSEAQITEFPINVTGPVEIPAEIAGLQVTSVGWFAFDGCTGLSSVTIPSSVTSIGDLAFRRCTGLTSITIPSSVTSIGISAFSDCTGLTSVTIPASVISIPDYAFGGCTGLTSVTISPGVTSIAGAYRGCTGPTSITIPSSVTSIDSAFSGCTGLTSITIPSSVTDIDEAFGCTGLTSITIPSSVTSIGEYTFANCTGLISVTIPSSVTFIGNSAFRGCTSLADITIPSSVTSIGGSTFYGCASLTKAVFLGNAFPIPDRFSNTAPGFTIYYLSSRTGFTSPTWWGYPATMINEATYPAASWLLAHELWYNANLDSDPNGDGVSLLMAYALNLDPRLNLQASLPVPVIEGNRLRVDFHATSPGITYRVETSTDLETWTTNGVVMSAPGADGRSTATIVRDDPIRFLRLTVQD